jgi:hypothetical protein
LEENYRPDVLFVWTSTRVRVYPADAVIPADRFIPFANAVKTASARTRKKIKNNLFLFLFLFFLIFFGSCCRLGKREFFFNFQFSIFGFQSPKSPKSPNSPNSPSSAGFAGGAARRRRFFRPSSPSHPSKLYSSLGWLNSKVPKPFPPFSLRLIDVDGF